MIAAYTGVMVRVSFASLMAYGSVSLYYLALPIDILLHNLITLHATELFSFAPCTCVVCYCF